MAVPIKRSNSMVSFSVLHLYTPQFTMLFKTMSAAVYGIDASIIEVEVDVSGIKTNEDHFHTVGLPDGGTRKS
jgi:hypothetical protein